MKSYFLLLQALIKTWIWSGVGVSPRLELGLGRFLNRSWKIFLSMTCPHRFECQLPLWYLSYLTPKILQNISTLSVMPLQMIKYLPPISILKKSFESQCCRICQVMKNELVLLWAASIYGQSWPLSEWLYVIFCECVVLTRYASTDFFTSLHEP